VKFRPKICGKNGWSAPSQESRIEPLREITPWAKPAYSNPVGAGCWAACASPRSARCDEENLARAAQSPWAREAPRGVDFAPAHAFTAVCDFPATL